MFNFRVETQLLNRQHLLEIVKNKQQMTYETAYLMESSRKQFQWQRYKHELIEATLGDGKRPFSSRAMCKNFITFIM